MPRYDDISEQIFGLGESVAKILQEMGGKRESPLSQAKSFLDILKAAEEIKRLRQTPPTPPVLTTPQVETMFPEYAESLRRRLASDRTRENILSGITQAGEKTETLQSEIESSRGMIQNLESNIRDIQGRINALIGPVKSAKEMSRRISALPPDERDALYNLLAQKKSAQEDLSNITSRISGLHSELQKERERIGEFQEMLKDPFMLSRREREAYEASARLPVPVAQAYIGAQREHRLAEEARQRSIEQEQKRQVDLLNNIARLASEANRIAKNLEEAKPIAGKSPEFERKVASYNTMLETAKILVGQLQPQLQKRFADILEQKPASPGSTLQDLIESFSSLSERLSKPQTPSGALKRGEQQLGRTPEFTRRYRLLTEKEIGNVEKVSKKEPGVVLMRDGTKRYASPELLSRIANILVQKEEARRAK